MKKLCFTTMIVVFLLLSTIGIQAQTESIKDIDGNLYRTVQIGTQLWMAENLKTTRYSNGDSIGTTSPASLDYTSENTPKYQWAYDGNESNLAVYGRLYTWYAVTDSRNICPIGWHVPNDVEWKNLITYLGGLGVAGGKLKEKGTTHWLKRNTGATNETGFTAFPGGFRGNSMFEGVGASGFWWLASEYNAKDAFCYIMFNFYRDVYVGAGDKKMGYSVRCLKDN